jgi:ATP-dependent exoDNAse (exonuclease V) beta subunit
VLRSNHKSLLPPGNRFQLSIPVLSPTLHTVRTGRQSQNDPDPFPYAHRTTGFPDIVQQSLADDASGRVAILVQGRSHLVNIVAELARRGVPFQATDIDPLGERPIVLDLLALTRAIAHPADRPAWLTVLRAPWCGLTLAELHAICGDESDATLPELLRDPGRHARLEPEARARLARAWNVLERAPDELRRFGLRDAVERAWLALGGPATAESERALDEAQAYFDELAELELRAPGPVDLRQLADALEDLYAPSRPNKANSSLTNPW